MKLYLETSLFGFIWDPHPRNQGKRRSVRQLLRTIRQGIHEAWVSPVVYGEIAESQEPYRSRDLGLIGKLGLGSVHVPRPLLNRLANAYGCHPQLYKVPLNDREHMAIFALSHLDALVTLNLYDFTRPGILKAVQEVNHAEGIRKEAFLITPQAVLEGPPSGGTGPGPAPRHSTEDGP